LNRGYLVRQTGFHPRKIDGRWVLDVDKQKFYSDKINDSKAFDELYDQFWEMRRHEVMDRDNYKCRMCGACTTLSVDHVKSRGAGGTDDAENLRTLCLSCHTTRHGW
jgi:5-methylcytosine-specific restriction endonuclease McrA